MLRAWCILRGWVLPAHKSLSHWTVQGKPEILLFVVSVLHLLHLPSYPCNCRTTLLGELWGCLLHLMCLAYSTDMCFTVKTQCEIPMNYLGEITFYFSERTLCRFSIWSYRYCASMILESFHPVLTCPELFLSLELEWHFNCRDFAVAKSRIMAAHSQNVC